MLDSAVEIIRTTDRNHPADASLRRTLEKGGGFSAGQRAQLSHAVFCYFRWLGWLERNRSLGEQINHALRLGEQFARQPLSFSDTDLIARVVPPWVRAELEITPVLARALQTEPKLWIRAQRDSGKVLAQKLQDCLIFGTGMLSDTLEYRGEQDLFRTAEFHHGEFELQDLSSQAVGFICAPQPGETWWDACAGEGGKLLHLATLMHNKGLIWASDRAEWRLRRLKRRAARAKVFNYRVAAWNGGSRLPTKTKFNGVLVDAPCSGTGTWHRNPDSRWTTTAQDVKELAAVQEQLLIYGSQALKSGGRLIYAVCTLTRSETRDVVEAFERKSPHCIPLKFLHPLKVDSSAQSQLRLGLEDFGGNGMFIAAWQRK